MRLATQVKHIIFDFDGVLAETNDIRIEGFRILFSAYPLTVQDALTCFVRANGGLSRYFKIRHFFEQILARPVSDEQVMELAQKYSTIVKDNVVEAAAVKGSKEFLAKWAGNVDFAIISGSDEYELRSVCSLRGIAHFFEHILGSPATKQENFQRLFDATGWQRQHCLFIGDTTNDLNAARAMGVPFLARSSGLENWVGSGITVISDLTELEEQL